MIISSAFGKSIGYISLGTHMAFISKIKIYQAVVVVTDKLLQLL